MKAKAFKWSSTNTDVRSWMVKGICGVFERRSLEVCSMFIVVVNVIQQPEVCQAFTRKYIRSGLGGTYLWVWALVSRVSGWYTWTRVDPAYNWNFGSSDTNIRRREGEKVKNLTAALGDYPNTSVLSVGLKNNCTQELGSWSLRSSQRSVLDRNLPWPPWIHAVL